jgi:hypothetical protein
VSSSVQNARALEAALQPLQGTAAVGKLVVKTADAGPDEVLHPGQCAVPVVGGQFSRQAMVFVRKNPAVTDGTWTITAAGTLVDVEALQGGERPNLPGGTPYRWDPPLEGIELESASDASGLAGGTWTGAYAGLRQVVYLKSLDANARKALFQALVSDCPAVVIAWAATAPLDGPLAGSPGPRTARVGQGTMLYRHTWFLFVVTKRLDGSSHRSLEGDTVRDDVLAILFGKKLVRNGVFQVSFSPGAHVQSANVQDVTPTSYIDRVTMETTVSFTAETSTDANPWLRSRLRQQTDPQAPDPPLDLPNIIIPMPPDGPGPGPYP